MPRLTPDEHPGGVRLRTRPTGAGPRPRPAPPALRITRRGRLVLLALAVAAVTLLVVGLVALVRLIAGPDDAGDTAAEVPAVVATVDPTCVPTPETTQNCWPAILAGNDDRMEQSPWVTGRLLAGDVRTVLDHVAERFDREVEAVDRDSSWGWGYRTVRGEGEDSGDLSNHASGTSIDLNATEHPLGSTGTFSAAQVAAIRSILAEVAPVVAWGGDFDGRADEMHFEIVGDPAAVAEVAARLRAG